MTPAMHDTCDAHNGGDISDRLPLYRTCPEVSGCLPEMDGPELTSASIPPSEKREKKHHTIWHCVGRVVRLICDAQMARSGDSRPVTPTFR